MSTHSVRLLTVAGASLLLMSGCGTTDDTGTVSQGSQTTGAGGAATTTAGTGNCAGVQPRTDDFHQVVSLATALPDGLRYGDITPGTGAAAAAGEHITMQYTGWLQDGSSFDSSRTRGQAFPFTLGNGEVIKGWDEGIVGMRLGGVRRLVIPAALGYGAAGQGPIPPNATLTFDVQLICIG